MKALSEICLALVLLCSIHIGHSLKCHYVKVSEDEIHECNKTTIDIFNEHFKGYHPTFVPNYEGPYNCMAILYNDERGVVKLVGCVHADDDYCSVPNTMNLKPRCYKCTEDYCNDERDGAQGLEFHLGLKIISIILPIFSKFILI